MATYQINTEINIVCFYFNSYSIGQEKLLELSKKDAPENHY